MTEMLKITLKIIYIVNIFEIMEIRYTIFLYI